MNFKIFRPVFYFLALLCLAVFPARAGFQPGAEQALERYLSTVLRGDCATSMIAAQVTSCELEPVIKAVLSASSYRLIDLDQKSRRALARVALTFPDLQRAWALAYPDERWRLGIYSNAVRDLPKTTKVQTLQLVRLGQSWKIERGWLGEQKTSISGLVAGFEALDYYFARTEQPSPPPAPAPQVNAPATEEPESSTAAPKAPPQPKPPTEPIAETAAPEQNTAPEQAPEPAEAIAETSAPEPTVSSEPVIEPKAPEPVVELTRSEPAPKVELTDQTVTAYLEKMVLEEVRVGMGRERRYGTPKRTLFGKVANRGDRTLVEVEITLRFLDDAGEVMREKTYYPVIDNAFVYDRDVRRPLRPKESREFGFFIYRDEPATWNGAFEAVVSKVKWVEN